MKLDEFSQEQDQIHNQIIGTTDPLPLEPGAKTVQWGPIPKERTAEEKKERRKRKNQGKERTEEKETTEEKKEQQKKKKEQQKKEAETEKEQSDDYT